MVVSIQQSLLEAGVEIAFATTGIEAIYESEHGRRAITLIPGRMSAEVDTGGLNLMTDYTRREFICRRRDLIALPQRDDKIILVDEWGHPDATYELLPDEGQQPYSKSDPQGTYLRLRTKRVEVH